MTGAVDRNRAVGAILYPLPPLPTPPSEKPPASVKIEAKPSPKFSHPFLLRLYELEIIDEDGWIRKDAKLPSLRPINNDRISHLLAALSNPFPLKFQYKNKTFELLLSPQQIMEFLYKDGGNNSLAGGFLQFLIGSKWFIQAAADLAQVSLEQLKSWMDPQVALDIDAIRPDIDFRNLRLNSKEDPHTILDKLMTHIAAQIAPKLKDKSEFIDALKGCFTCHTRFDLVDGEIDQNGIVLGCKNIKGEKVEIYIASISKTNAILSTQKIQMSLAPWGLAKLNEEDKDKSPKLSVTPAEAFQAVADVIGEAVHYCSSSHAAWMRGLARNQGRVEYAQEMPSKVYVSLKNYCALFKENDHPNLNIRNTNPHVHLLAEYHKNHPLKNSAALLALAFSAASSLHNAKWPDEGIAKFWKAFQINMSELPSALSNIFTSIHRLSYQLTASVLHLKSLGSRMIEVDGNKMFLPNDARKSLSVLCESISQIQKTKNRTAKNMLLDLLNSIPNGEVGRDLNVAKEDCEFLMQCQEPEFVELGHLLFLHSIASSNPRECLKAIYFSLPKLSRESFQRVIPAIIGNLRLHLPELPESFYESLPKAEPENILIHFVKTKNALCVSVMDEIAPLIHNRSFHPQLMTVYLQNGLYGKALNLLLQLEIKKRSLGSSSVGNFINILEAFQKASLKVLTGLAHDKFISISTVARMLIGNFPDCREALESKLIGLVDKALKARNPALASSLLQLLIKDKNLTPSKHETFSLWLRCCEVLYYDSDYGFQHALELWNLGEEYSIWKQQAFESPELIPFLLSFIEEYLAAPTRSTILPNRILNKIPKYLQDRHRDQVQGIIQQIEQKDRRSPDNDIKTLCRPCESREEYRNNIANARLILIRYDIRNYFRNDLRTLLDLHAMVLEAATAEDIDPNIPFGIIESAFNLLMNNPHVRIAPAFLNAFLPSLHLIRERRAPQGLMTILQSCHGELCRSLTQRPSLDSYFEYLIFLAYQQYSIVPSAADFLDVHLKALSEYFQSCPAQAPPRTLKVLSYLYECRPQESSIQDIRIIEEVVNLVDHLNRANLVEDAVCWIEYVVQLMTTTSQTFSVTTLEKIVDLFSLFQRINKLDLLFRMISKFKTYSEHLENKIFDQLIANPKQVVKEAPQLSGQLLINRHARDVYFKADTIEDELSSIVIQTILNPKKVPENDMTMAYELLRAYPRNPDETVELVLLRTSESTNHSVKTKVWRLYRTRYIEINSKASFPNPVPQTWINCWTLSMTLFRELSSSMDVDDCVIESLEFYLNMNHLDLDGFIDDVRKFAPITDLDTLMFESLSSVDVPEKRSRLIDKLIEVRNQIYPKLRYNSLLRLTDKIDLHLAAILCKSKNYNSYLNGCKVLYRLFKNPAGDIQKKIDLLAEYLYSLLRFVEPGSDRLTNQYLVKMCEHVAVKYSDYEVTKVNEAIKEVKLKAKPVAKVKKKRKSFDVRPNYMIVIGHAFLAVVLVISALFFIQDVYNRRKPIRW